MQDKREKPLKRDGIKAMFVFKRVSLAVSIVMIKDEGHAFSGIFYIWKGLKTRNQGFYLQIGNKSLVSGHVQPLPKKKDYSMEKGLKMRLRMVKRPSVLRLSIERILQWSQYRSFCNLKCID